MVNRLPFVQKFIPFRWYNGMTELYEAANGESIQVRVRLPVNITDRIKKNYAI